MRRTSNLFLGFVVAVGIVGTIAHSSVHALDPDTDANAAQGIQISPALVELNGDPGKTYSINISVFNVTASTLSYASSIDDFKAKDETGTPQVIVDDTLPPTVSVRSWIAPIPQFILRTHQTKAITAQVTIPTNAEPGGHYGVIQFSGTAPAVEETGVGLSASAGVLLLIRVSGDVTEKANLASFTSSQNGHQGFFFEYGPIDLVTRVQNTGNVHIAPVGNIQLHNMFGQLVTTMKVNTDASNVLPDSIRRFTSTYDKKWMFGRYTADLTVGYGTTGQAITGEVSFWVIPYKLVLGGMLVLVTLIFILSRIIKMYNRHIINKANNATSKTKKHRKNKK